jgi:DNA repair protein RecN (Recombination protein N)
MVLPRVERGFLIFGAGMLTALAIRDVVLIERLDLTFGPGLTALTGETGAGKSILLDSLGLALGMRAEAALVRTGAAQASVTAVFSTAADHPVYDALSEQGLAPDEELTLRRVLGQDGRSRAFINDQPVGIALLKRIGSLLVEVQGQHEQMGLADPASHVGLLDAFGVAPELRAACGEAWRRWRGAANALEQARTAVETARRDEDWLRHAVEELGKLAPEPDEEEHLAQQRQLLQHAERRAEAIAAAVAELTPRDRRGPGPAAAVRAACRTLQRMIPGAANPAEPAIAALERAEEALAEAEALLTRLAQEIHNDPRHLERIEERLFALRAAARKHGVTVAELPELTDSLRSRLGALDTGVAEIAALERTATQARGEYAATAQRLSQARREAASRLDRTVAKELPPLRLDKARFVAEVTKAAEAAWGPGGTDGVRFQIATNPGQEPGPLARVASGGELSRLMLALKVVLASASPVPTLVFDEVDAGIGGATAAAVGERLGRVAERLQVLVVTHSPQVAARGAVQLRVSKRVGRGRTTTQVEALDQAGRREEIARMLAGERITESARAAADELLGTAA